MNIVGSLTIPFIAALIVVMLVLIAFYRGRDRQKIETPVIESTDWDWPLDPALMFRRGVSHHARKP